MCQVQFRGIDTTLGHDGGNNEALSHDETLGEGEDVAENETSGANGSSNHRDTNRQAHACAECVEERLEGVQKLIIYSIMCCYRLGAWVVIRSILCYYRLGAWNFFKVDLFTHSTYTLQTRFNQQAVMKGEGNGNAHYATIAEPVT